MSGRVFNGAESDDTYRERNRWLVEALRSGGYEQGKQTMERHYLDDSGEVTEKRLCCLGVACHVAMEHGLALNFRTVTASDSEPEILKVPGTVMVQYWVGDDLTDDSGRDVPPYAVAQWFGWYENNPYLKTGDSGFYGSAAATRNDAGETFEQIADAFEYTYVEDSGPPEPTPEVDYLDD